MTKKILLILFVLLTDSHGGQAVFVPDVDYLGDPYRTGCNPKTQEEEPLASLYQATMCNFDDLQRS